MRSPKKRLTTDPDGICRDVEELQWLAYNAGFILLKMASSEMMQALIDPDILETFGTLGALGMESAIGYDAMADKLLEMVEIPKKMRPAMKEFMLKMRSLSDEDEDEQDDDEEDVLGQIGKEETPGTPVKHPYIIGDLPPSIQDFINGLDI